ncbi:MAG: FHA domain-containing protein [Myxococcales bacterium FL481]|nr:MAG: FHA domain-containing protein [Myxococcales bacterium FL481]
MRRRATLLSSSNAGTTRAFLRFRPAAIVRHSTRRGSSSCGGAVDGEPAAMSGCVDPTMGRARRVLWAVGGSRWRCHRVTAGTRPPDIVAAMAGAPILLVVHQGPDRGREYTLAFGANVVGRGDAADVPVRGRAVSRRHACVEVRDEGVFVVDVGSKNGVFVDGQRVAPGRRGTRLEDGGRIELGDVVLVLDDARARVTRVLAEAGEITVTRQRPPLAVGPRAEPRPSPALPLLVASMFAVVVYLLWRAGR